MSGPRVRDQFVNETQNAISGVELGYAFVVSALKQGPTFGIALNEADFRDKYGSSPLSGHENEYYNIIEFFRNATVGGICYGKLWIARAFHYTDPTDPDTITAAKGSATWYDTDSTATLKIEDQYYRDSPLSIEVVAGSADSTAFFDLVVYENSVERERIHNCNMDSTSANYVVKLVGDNRDYKAIDLGPGTLPDTNGDMLYNLSGGSDGSSGLDSSDYIGAEHADGNIGMYQILDYINTIQKPEYMFMPYLSPATYDATLAVRQKTFALFCSTYGIIPVMGTPRDINRTNARAYVLGLSPYTHAAIGDANGGWIFVWPSYTPSDLIDTSPRVKISPEGKKAGLLMAVIGRSWIHQVAAGIEDGAGTAIGELYYDTKDADSTLLDPVGIQVIRKDIGGVVFGHKIRSSTPDFYYSENVRRLDNYANQSINLSTQRLLHKPLTESMMRDLEREIKVFFLGIFKAHPDAFRYSDFDKNVYVDVVGQNIIGSDDWNAGKLYTYRRIAWSGAVQEIIHKYAHTTTQSVEV